MKKVLLTVALVAVFTFALVGSAFAAQGNSGYSTWAPASQPVGAQDNPHTVYLTNTVKCSVCHAVHGAAAGGEALLGDTKANACNFCHVSLSAAYTVVYDGVVANYTNGNGSPENAHDSSSGATCTLCHAVHGANTITMYSGGSYVNRNLKQLANPDGYASARVGYSATAFDSVADTSVGDATNDGLSQWCAGCHPYYNTAVNGRTHVMKAADATHAFTASSTCKDCHDSTFTATSVLTGTGTKGATFPHIADGARFLNVGGDSTAEAAAADLAAASQDGACLKCHRNGTIGVGISF